MSEPGPRRVNIGSRERAVLSAANAWWVSRRPLDWSTTQHLATPNVNMATEMEKALARSVANLVRERRIRSGQRRALASEAKEGR